MQRREFLGHTLAASATLGGAAAQMVAAASAPASFHYIGPDESEVDEYVRKNAVSR